MKAIGRWIVIAVALASATAAGAQPAPAPANLIGCYALQVESWWPRIGTDSLYYRIPSHIRLDSMRIEGRPGWLLSPNIRYPGPRRSSIPGTPRWDVAHDTLRLTWSNGFSSTIMTLHAADDALIGEAIARNDYSDGRPVARTVVRARRHPCS